MKFESKDNEATLWVYDAIGEMFGPTAVTAKVVRDALAELSGVSKLYVRFNTPGGICDESCAINTLLSEFPGEKIGKVDGVCASAGIDIAMACDTVQIAPAAMMMIHNPWGMAVGDYREFDKASLVSQKYRNARAGFISKRSRKRPETVLKAMDAETWFTGQEAVDWGLADDASVDKAVAFSKEDNERIISYAKEVARIAAIALVADEGSDATSALAEHALEIGRKINAANRERELSLRQARVSA